MPHQFIEQLGEKFCNMVTNMHIFLLIVHQYLVPALKDRMKYNRNYDSSKRSARKVEEVTTLEKQPPLMNDKVFKPKDCPKLPTMPVLSLGGRPGFLYAPLEILAIGSKKSSS